MGRAKARSILKGLADENEQDQIIMFLEYKIEEGDFDLDEICLQLEEDFNVSKAKTRQLISALGGSKKVEKPRVIQKPKPPRSFPGKASKSTSPKESSPVPQVKTRPTRGRGKASTSSVFSPPVKSAPSRGRGTRGRRGRGTRGRGRGRGIRPVSFPGMEKKNETKKPTEIVKPKKPERKVPTRLKEKEEPPPEEVVQAKKPEGSASSASTQKEEEEEDDTTCFICAEEAEYWAIANCGHSCCARCAVKYRWTFNWLGKARIKKKPICPWCRQPWKRICIGKQGLQLSDFDRSLPFDKQLKVTYQTREERAYFHKLLEMRCPICDEPNGGYQSLDGLKAHMRDKHNSFLCTLCLDNTSKFLDEHEIYSSKQQLKKHKNKIHPKCSMCNTHFFNQDVLDSHMKNEHPTCPGKDCANLVFRNMNEARGHYRTAHYLCERDNCRHGLELYFTRDELNLHIQEVHANPICPVAAPVVKSRKAKRRPRKVEGNGKQVRLEEMGHLIEVSLGPDLVIYHQLLFSANIDSQLLFKSFRVCWESQVEFDVWEKFWLKYISTIEDPAEANELHNLYRAYCHDPLFDSSIQRWSPSDQRAPSMAPPQRRSAPMNPGYEEEIIFGNARPKPASSRNVTQPASREVLYGPWAGRRKNNSGANMQPRSIPKPSARGPALRGVWAQRSGAMPQPTPFPSASGKKKKKKKKKRTASGR